MLHMVSGVIALVVSSFSAHVKQNSDQLEQRTNTKVEDISFLASKNKEETNNKRRNYVCELFRSEMFLNRLGFFMSFLFILAANCVMLNAKLSSTGCVPLPF
jgi:K+-transporting ATPase A subunit